jgi:predicted dehydrogenase
MTRRHFLVSSATFAGWATFSPGAEPGQRKKTRAAIIGHTGQGNYGHELDLIFNGRAHIEVVAVADPDSAGRARAAARANALRQYADYREMLEKEEPQLVCVAPRWTDQHHAMAMVALQSGAHVYLEKPVTRTLAEADELLAASKLGGLKIAVAHQMRLAPNILALKQAIDSGLIGDLLEVRAHGKQDHRAGGEDLVVLGVHLFDLMRFFAGDALWCEARVLQSGKEITARDARSATENIGPVAGDEIMAQFAFGRGVQASFTSRARNRETAGPWGMELIGSRGTVKILMEMIPRIYFLQVGSWTPQGMHSEWRVWDQDPTVHLGEAERGFASANKRVVDDWLEAIREKREPICSGAAAMRALELAMAVFASGLARSRVGLPLKERRHPLGA